MKPVAIFLMAILAASVTIPMAFSDDGKKDGTKVNDKVQFGFSNGTNVGQQISAFVHKMHDIFKQQETQEKQVIKDCREKAREASSPTERKNIMNECKAKLKEIKEQFRDQHKQFQADFKQFRNMVVGNNQENHEKISVPKNDTKFQNKTQTFGKQHGLEQKLQHQGQKQGHGKIETRN